MIQEHHGGAYVCSRWGVVDTQTGPIPKVIKVFESKSNPHIPKKTTLSPLIKQSETYPLSQNPQKLNSKYKSLTKSTEAKGF